jgi:hypothetical protein
MAWWCGWCVIAGVSPPIRREVVVEFGTSIDGSLLYGDLPAPDGAETTDIAEALVSELGSAPQHPKEPVTGSVLYALISGVGWCRARAVLNRSPVIEPR